VPASDGRLTTADPSAGRKHLATANDEAHTAASVETLMSVAPLFRLDEHDSVEVLREVLAATGHWREVVAQRNIPKVEIEEMAPAFEHAETEAARTLTDAQAGRHDS
jgi:hypothetical protein